MQFALAHHMPTFAKRPLSDTQRQAFFQQAQTVLQQARADLLKQKVTRATNTNAVHHGPLVVLIVLLAPLRVRVRVRVCV